MEENYEKTEENGANNNEDDLEDIDEIKEKRETICKKRKIMKNTTKR